MNEEVRNIISTAAIILSVLTFVWVEWQHARNRREGR